MDSLVSVIIPVHNCESYIEESVKSICTQTYKDVEIIIVDTNSEDKTINIAKQIYDDRIKIIKLKDNKGLSYAFYEGLKHAKGEFILRQDPDDTSSPKRIENQVNYLKSHNAVDMVSCLIKCVTNDSSYGSSCIFIEKIQNNYVNSESIERAILGNFIPILFPTLMIRREALNKVNVKETAEGFDDQMDLILNLLKLSRLEKIDKVLYYYRRHKDAYHIINELEYEKYVTELLSNKGIKTFLKYRSFYENLNIGKPVNLALTRKSSIRVLMLIDALNVGGTETHVLNLTKKLIDMGIYVIVGTSGGPFEEVYKQYGIKVVRIPLDSDYISNKYLFSKLNMVKKIVDEEGINIIHCHLFASMRIGSEMYRRYRIPYVVTIHGLFYPNDVLYSTCIKAASVIAVSEPVKDMILNKLGNRCEGEVKVIPNGIDMELEKNIKNKQSIRKELNIPQDSIVLSYCSRIDWGKTNAAEAFIFSCFKLASEYKNIHAIVIGDGVDKNIISRETGIINDMLKREVIHLVGVKSNVLDYYIESDIVVGTGRVALEAMSCSKPVIAIGNEGYVGIISYDNNDIQWKTYFGDHEALEKADVTKLVMDIKKLTDNKEYCKKVGRWSRAWCKEKFDNNVVSSEIVNVYRKTLDLKRNNDEISIEEEYDDIKYNVNNYFSLNEENNNVFEYIKDILKFENYDKDNLNNFEENEILNITAKLNILQGYFDKINDSNYYMCKPYI